MCREAGVPLIVDEAHGSHLAFVDESSAVGAGADLVVQSTHKTLTALSQAAMLHQGHASSDSLGQAVADTLPLVQSTSPSALLLASLDQARQQAASRAGVVRLRRAKRLAALSKRKVQKLGYDVVTSPVSGARSSDFVGLDPLRMTVFVPSGYDADDALIEKFGVYCELPEDSSITFAFSAGTTAVHVRLLLEALRDFKHNLAEFGEGEGNGEGKGGEGMQAVLENYSGSSELACSMPPRDAVFAVHDKVALTDAVGRVSASTICTYPPGVPIVLPGEMVTTEAVSFLVAAQRAGATITGGVGGDEDGLVLKCLC